MLKYALPLGLFFPRDLSHFKEDVFSSSHDTLIVVVVLFLDSFIPELGQHLQHVDADLLRIIIQPCADDAKTVQCQYPATPCGLLDYATAYADGRLTFTFKNGSTFEG